MGLRFTWDNRKAAANLRTHGVSFAEAATASALDLPRAVSAISMKKAEPAAKKSRAASAKKAIPTRRQRATEMRAEYDFTGGVRGKYAGAFAQGSNVVVLAPDLAAEFRSATAVNRALRAYLEAKSARRTA